MSVAAPLSLVVASLGALRLGIPVDAVDRVLMAAEVTPLADMPAAIVGVINIHGEVMPVVDLRARFRLPPKALQASDHFVIVRLGGRALAVTFDDVLDTSHFDRDALTPAPQVLPWIDRIHGIVQLEDGLLVVKDPARFLDVDDWNALSASEGESP